MEVNSFILWLTGLPAAGKTSLGRAILAELKSRNKKARHLDGDEVRAASPVKLGFTKEDRDKNIKLAIALADKYQRQGYIVIASFISPYREHREWGRQSLNSFIEIFVNAPLAVCEARDPKQLYKKVSQGEIACLTGVDDPYEEPLNPEINIKTSELTLADSVREVMNYLENNKFI